MSNRASFLNLFSFLITIFTLLILSVLLPPKLNIEKCLDESLISEAYILESTQKTDLTCEYNDGLEYVKSAKYWQALSRLNRLSQRFKGQPKFQRLKILENSPFALDEYKNEMLMGSEIFVSSLGLQRIAKSYLDLDDDFVEAVVSSFVTFYLQEDLLWVDPFLKHKLKLDSQSLFEDLDLLKKDYSIFLGAFFYREWMNLDVNQKAQSLVHLRSLLDSKNSDKIKSISKKFESKYLKFKDSEQVNFSDVSKSIKIDIVWIKTLLFNQQSISRSGENYLDMRQVKKIVIATNESFIPVHDRSEMVLSNQLRLIDNQGTTTNIYFDSPLDSYEFKVVGSRFKLSDVPVLYSKHRFEWQIESNESSSLTLNGPSLKLLVDKYRLSQNMGVDQLPILAKLSGWQDVEWNSGWHKFEPKAEIDAVISLKFSNCSSVWDEQCFKFN